MAWPSTFARPGRHDADPGREPAVIALHGVTKTFGPVRALVGVSCAFPPGSITVLRGPNGSGKSTLLSIVGTMTRPTAGRVDHGELGPDRRRPSGMVEPVDVYADPHDPTPFHVRCTVLPDLHRPS